VYVRPNHRAIKQYHAHLRQFEGEQVFHETAVCGAFQTLLAGTARARKWMIA